MNFIKSLFVSSPKSSKDKTKPEKESPTSKLNSSNNNTEPAGASPASKKTRKTRKMNTKVKSLPESLEDNVLMGLASEEELPTPPPSPVSKEGKGVKPSVFSMAQVSMKFNELWSTAQERLFGEDYWIPSNVYDVVIFPNEYLKNHHIIYPPKVDEINGPIPVLRVVQSQKQSEVNIINHVVFSHAGHRETLSIFRTLDVNEAIDFYRRCNECRVLFKMLDLGTHKDIRRLVRDLTNRFQAHPLWRMVHIAIACSRTDVFTEDGLEFLRKMGYSENDLTRTVAQPEGKYPVQLAIETNQPDIVRFLFRLGADISIVDTEGNNCLHYAALASTQMIDIVWAQEGSKNLLNALNHDRNSPVLLAIRNANPFCLRALVKIGADMSIRIAGKNPLFEAVQSKGKTTDIIRAIIDAQPDLLTEVDEATGNTVLHAALYKMPLMGVLNLRRGELDLNAKNKAGHAALHLFTSRGDIGMIITISSYGCSMNTQDDNGNTALHIAVSKSNLSVTRLLLCLGSDPNVLNKHGDSPRHLAAKLHDHNLLKSLIMFDAKRCTHLKTGCVSGCVDEKFLRIMPNSNAAQTMDVSDVKSPRSLAKIEELEAPEQMVQQHSWNAYTDYEHDLIYDEIIERLAEMTKNKEANKNILNVLCLDGGGIRGLAIIQILLEVEYQMKESVFCYFDWVAGTSTGALVATALSQGKNCRECQMIYLRFKDLIFDGWVRPYKSAILEAFIKAEVGDKTLLGDLKWPRLMFTTTRADVFPVQLEFMRNYQLPLSAEENEKIGYFDPGDLLLWKALRRTSAAPTYFSSVDNKYIDGGIIANNPTLDLLAEIQTWNTVCKTLNRPANVEIGCLLSIGTGVIPNCQMDASQLDISNNPYSAAVAIKNLGVILVDQVTATEGAPVNRASSWCITRRTPYFRLSAPLHKEVAMDERDDAVLAKMMWDCKEYTYRQRPYIDKICKLLKLIGPAESRRHLFEQSDCQSTQTSRPPSACSTAIEDPNFNPDEEPKTSSSEDNISEARNTARSFDINKQVAKATKYFTENTKKIDRSTSASSFTENGVSTTESNQDYEEEMTCTDSKNLANGGTTIHGSLNPKVTRGSPKANEGNVYSSTKHTTKDDDDCSTAKE